MTWATFSLTLLMVELPAEKRQTDRQTAEWNAMSKATSQVEEWSA